VWQNHIMGYLGILKFFEVTKGPFKKYVLHFWIILDPSPLVSICVILQYHTYKKMCFFQELIAIEVFLFITYSGLGQQKNE
jgi:hypothetical protein